MRFKELQGNTPIGLKSAPIRCKDVTKSYRLFMNKGPLFILFSLHGILHTPLRYWCVFGIAGRIILRYYSYWFKVCTYQVQGITSFLRFIFWLYGTNKRSTLSYCPF
jgi:hypothetical protein